MSSATIAAIATPPGRGGIGIVRVSGDGVPGIAHALLGGLPQPRRAEFVRFLDAAGGPIDSGLALYFPGPRSFTGEHVLELQGHGGPVVMDLLLARVLSLGARPAQPGEFARRAFTNGKLDLVQAEAVADLIEADSAAAARSAQRSLAGEFSLRVRALVKGLVELRAYIEAAFDFPEEEIDFLASAQIEQRLGELAARLAHTLADASQGCLLREGLTVVIAGPPNVGKSSLLNRLAGRETAIVTEVPGTTRDLLREHISVDGLPLHVIDTAGLRLTDDVVERIGVERAHAAIQDADAVLLVADDREGPVPDSLRTLPEHLPVLLVRNKIDLSGSPAGAAQENGQCVVRLSAKQGLGLEALATALKNLVGYAPSPEGVFTARRRHLEALRRAADALEVAAARRLEGAGELLAEELRVAQQALGEITGEFTSEDLLDRIFAEFCIGK